MFFSCNHFSFVILGNQELSDEIEDYTHRFNTEDQVEWNLVLQEVAAFIEVSSWQERLSELFK